MRGQHSNPKNVLLIGNGQVGSALAGLISRHHNLTVMDAEATSAKGGMFDVMHICFPYTDKFVDLVCGYITKFNPTLTLIESTVIPETTKQIFARNPTREICHSPVRGCHSSLPWGVKTYTKFVGPCTLKAGLNAERYYRNMNLKTRLCKSSTETELAKLLNLSYYASQIAFFQELERKVKHYGACLDDVNDFIGTTTDDSNGTVVRPILKSGYIGGTCVMQGLEKIFGGEMLYLWIKGSNDKEAP